MSAPAADAVIVVVVMFIVFNVECDIMLVRNGQNQVHRYTVKVLNQHVVINVYHEYVAIRSFLFYFSVHDAIGIQWIFDLMCASIGNHTLPFIYFFLYENGRILAINIRYMKYKRHTEITPF